MNLVKEVHRLPVTCCLLAPNSTALLMVQFMSIIRDTPEDSVKATYATKVATLVESYAQPAEYATTMASVLVAAGNAAPKSLASRIASTLAVCGESHVQADTAKVFATMLHGADSLSDAQMLVRHFPSPRFATRS